VDLANLRSYRPRIIRSSVIPSLAWYIKQAFFEGIDKDKELHINFGHRRRIKLNY
jgi:hypothetical protein